jgi:glucose/arabinose dehydrogenase
MSRGRAWLNAAVGALAIAGAICGAADRAAAGGGGLDLRRLGSFALPVHVEDAPGKPKLLFVVEQRGTVAVLRNGRELGKPLLDLRRRVRRSYEEGMLSIAFDPDYRRNRRFFVYYVNRAGDIEVDSFKHKRGKPTRASARSRRTVIVVEHPGEANHNGGQLQFGPDGLLYVGTGDGGGGGDPGENAQDPESLLGKLLRIAPRRGGGYDSPASNPFAGGPGRDEIFALGLRNPWRFSFDRANGHLTIGDVGQGRWEEIDHLTAAAAAGANFGWDNLEGNHPFEDPGSAPPGYRPPIHEYAGGASVIAGYVVRDPGLPALAGRLLYADLGLGRIRSLDPDAANPSATDAPTGLSVDQPSSFGEGAGGKLYVASLGDGAVYRIVRR